MRERLKSPVVWLAVIAQVALVIAMYNPEVADNLKIVATAIVEIMTLFGVLNDPTTRERF